MNTKFTFKSIVLTGGTDTNVKLTLSFFNTSTQLDQNVTFLLRCWDLPGVVSVKEVETSNFKVYPNPVVDIVNIQMDNHQDTEVVIMDMVGRVVRKDKTSNMINYSMLDQPNGMYVIKIGSDSHFFIKE